MDHDIEFTAPTKIPDFTGLRLRVLDRLWLEPLAVFAGDEAEGFANWFQDACVAYKGSEAYDGPISCVNGHRDYRANPGLNIIERDYDSPADIPKWVMLHAWLTPESVAGHCPKTVEELARLMLSNRLKNYKAQIPTL